MSVRVEIDAARRELRVDGELVAVQRRVFDLLAYLAQHSERAVSRTELLREVWGDVVVTEGSLNQAVRSARRAIGDDPLEPRVLTTVRGYGYRWVAPGSARSVPPSAPPPPRAAVFGDSTVERDERPSSSEREALVIAVGADGADVGPRALSLDGIDEVAIGRAGSPVALSSGRLLTIGAASSTLSRQHARLVRGAGGRMTLEDGGGANGTRLRGRRVGRIEVEDGDWIGCGPMLLCYRRHPDVSVPGWIEDGATLAPALARPLAHGARLIAEAVPWLLRHAASAEPAGVVRRAHERAGRAGALVVVRAEALDDTALALRLASAERGTLCLLGAESLPPPRRAALAKVVEPSAEAGTAMDVALVLCTSDPQAASELTEALGAHAATLPPLSQRLEDLGRLLAELDPAEEPAGHGRWSPAALDALLAHTWPGEERELSRVVRAARAIAATAAVETAHLPEELRRAR